MARAWGTTPDVIDATPCELYRPMIERLHEELAAREQAARRKPRRRRR